MAPYAPTRSMQPGLVARYQLLTLAVASLWTRLAHPEVLTSFLTGALLVALNLQLSRAMLPLLAHLRSRGASQARQMAWVGAASGGKLLIQLVVAAAVLIQWPPESSPFMWGLATFVGGLVGATCHSIARAGRHAPSAGHPRAG